MRGGGLHARTPCVRHCLRGAGRGGAGTRHSSAIGTWPREANLRVMRNVFVAALLLIGGGGKVWMLLRRYGVGDAPDSLSNRGGIWLQKYARWLHNKPAGRCEREGWGLLAHRLNEFGHLIVRIAAVFAP